MKVLYISIIASRPYHNKCIFYRVIVRFSGLKNAVFARTRVKNSDFSFRRKGFFRVPHGYPAALHQTARCRSVLFVIKRTSLWVFGGLSVNFLVSNLSKLPLFKLTNNNLPNLAET